MNFNELLMMFCILAVVAILMYKIYNLMTLCKMYEEPVAWLTLVGLIIARMMAFLVFLDQLDFMYTGVYKWVVWLSYFGIMLGLVEILIYQVNKLPVARGRYAHKD